MLIGKPGEIFGDNANHAHAKAGCAELKAGGLAGLIGAGYWGQGGYSMAIASLPRVALPPPEADSPRQAALWLRGFAALGSSV